ncbi:MAG TPA: TonB-dependent receptor, partial [Phenylobacterium sp.]
LHWGNEMFGKTYGVDVWADYRVAPWWRISLSYSDLTKQLKFRPGSSGLLGTAQAGDDPRYRASLRSSMNLGPAVTLDGTLRYVSALPDPRVRAYTELDGRIGWHINDQVQLSVSGFNLLHKRHLEFPAAMANAVPRSFVVGLQWGF